MKVWIDKKDFKWLRTMQDEGRTREIIVSSFPRFKVGMEAEVELEIKDECRFYFDCNHCPNDKECNQVQDEELNEIIKEIEYLDRETNGIPLKRKGCKRKKMKIKTNDELRRENKILKTQIKALFRKFDKYSSIKNDKWYKDYKEELGIE